MLIDVNKMSFVVFDIETTGLNPDKGDAVIELAGQKVVNGEIVGVFNELVNPGVEISPQAFAVHGISDDIIKEQGKPLDQVIPDFIDFCEECVLVGHNIVKFDLRFIKKHSQDLGLIPKKYKVIDTLILSRQILILPSYKLQSLAEYFGIPYIGAHRALQDVDINRRVFMKLLELYKETTF